MSFSALPKDLKNIVTDFAYEASWENVRENLEVCENIKKMNLSPVLVRFTMWSFKYQTFMPSPLMEFEPICNFTGRWSDYIDWSAVQEILFRLDYRRRWVNFVYSRDDWRKLFEQNWTNIEQFDAFFRFLIYTKVDCLKPLWKQMGFGCLKSYGYPYVNGRWWLNGF